MDVIIAEGIDPGVTKPGGTRSYIMSLIELLSKADANIILIGATNPNYVHNEPYSFVPIIKGNKIAQYKFLFMLFLKAPFLDFPRSAIIHLHRPDTALPFLLFFRKNPKVLTVHGRNYKWGYIHSKGIIVGGILEIISKFVISRMDKNIFVDEASKEFCKIPGNKGVVIPVGINTKIFKPMDKTVLREKYKFNENDKVILYVGRLKKEKGLDILIKAFAKVQKEIPDCKLVLVGGGVEKENLSNLVSDLELSNIQFMNTIDHNEIPGIMNCADVFALCSLYEGMPTVVLEALACGVPVVSTDVGDVHKVVHDNETGYIVRTRTEEEMSAKLMKVLSNRDKFKENCIEVAQEYSWDKIAKKILEIYNELLEKKSNPKNWNK